MTEFMNIVEEIIVENAKLKKEVEDLKTENRSLKYDVHDLMLREHETQAKMHNLFYEIENTFKGLYEKTDENFDLLHIYLKKIKRVLKSNRMIK